MIFGCNFCGANFKDNSNDESRARLLEHKENCTKDKPFFGDDTAIFYDETTYS